MSVPADAGPPPTHSLAGCQPTVESGLFYLTKVSDNHLRNQATHPAPYFALDLTIAHRRDHPLPVNQVLSTREVDRKEAGKNGVGVSAKSLGGIVRTL